MQRSALIDKHLPFKSNFISICGFQMHYLDEGQGPVILLLHGNPTWSFYFRNLIETLKKNFRVIAPDYIGCGLSDHPKEMSYRASDRIDQIQAFVEALGLNKFSIVMHDWGGSIGTGLAVNNADRIERLVYLNTTLTETESLPTVIKLAAHPLIGKFLTKHSKFFVNVTTSWGVINKLPKEIRAAYAYPYRTRADRSAIWSFVQDIPFSQRHPTYAEMLNLAKKIPLLAHVPVQVVWGIKDICFHRDMLNNVLAHFPQAQVLEIPEASHLVLEDAKELCCTRINQFMLADASEVSLQGKRGRESASPEAQQEMNAVYQAFLRVAAERPDQLAVVEPSFLVDQLKFQQLSYLQLRNLVNQYQRGLTELGLKVGDKVLMLVTPSIEFIALSYAVMGRGAVPFFLDPGMGPKKLVRCIADINPDVLLCSPKALILRIFNWKLFHSCRFKLLATHLFSFGIPNLGLLKRFSTIESEPVCSTGTALVAYTSGATGVPKGVVFTDQMVQRQLQIFRDVFGMQAGRKDLPLLPIFSLFNVANGVSAIFPPINIAAPLTLDPVKIVHILNELKVDYSFGSPTLWKKISEYCVRSRKFLPSLEKVFIAGAPVSKDTLVQVQEVLPNGQAYTPYGATEALPVTLVSAHELLALKEEPASSGEQGVYVGKPIEGVDLKVIFESEQVITSIALDQCCAPYQIGEVLVSGEHISREYFNREDANTNGKINDNKKLWHRMGDVGYLDQSGGLYFCGRKAHVVEFDGQKYYSVPMEGIFNKHPKVYRSALVSLEACGLGLVVEPHPQYWPQDEPARARFIEELQKLASVSTLGSKIARFFFHPSFPVDGRHNAKIFRDQLAIWAQSELAASNKHKLDQ